MKKLFIALTLLTHIHNTAHAMKITKPTDSKLAQASINISQGLDKFDAEQFEKGYNVHRQMRANFIENIKSTTIPLEIQSLCSFEELTMRRLLSLKEKIDRGKYTPKIYQTHQQFKVLFGLGLLTIGTFWIGSSAMDMYQISGDDTASWWQLPLAFQSSIGALAMYSGQKLVISGHEKSQQAEEIISQRKKAIEAMFLCTQNGTVEHI